MKKRVAGALAFLLILVSLAFSGAQAEAPIPRISADEEREIVVNGAVWQLSAEARACFYQAFALARYRLQDALDARTDTTKPAAIITDVDDTLVDGVMYTADVLQDGPWNTEAFYASLASTACKALPGAVETMNEAAQKGVEVFYITNRPASFLDITVAQLAYLGFPYADAEHVLLMDAENPSSNKDARRQKVMDNFDVLLLLGDNLVDFSSAFAREQGAVTRRDQVDEDEFRSLWGEKWIILPNAVYGDFTGAVTENRKGVSTEDHLLKIRELFDHYKYTNQTLYEAWYEAK